MNAAWEPTLDDLNSLLVPLSAQSRKFKKAYGPIRHKIYAHRSNKNEEEVHAHFSETLIEEVEEILRFLYTLVIAIHEIATNGRKPDLSNFTNYDIYVKRIDTDVEAFILQLAVSVW
jgi:hypothetical protein